MSGLRGRRVAITGASRGIGAAAARRFAWAGTELLLLARNRAALEALADETGGTARVVDMADGAAVHAALTETPVDVLVNNAGIIDPIARLADSEPGAWERVVAVNLCGVYRATRAVLPGMVARGGGTIVTLSSGAANAPLEGWSHYCATKAAVQMLTRCIDREYRAEGIRAMGLSPGTVRTDMQKVIRASGVNPVSRLAPDDHIPPDWAARAVEWLVTSAPDAVLGTDFSIKTEAGRRAVGLPAG